MAETLIYVAFYQHEHGTDVFVCPTEAEAWALREGFARENWADAFPGEPRPAAEVGEVYFARMREGGDAFDPAAEFFAIHPTYCDPSRFLTAAPPLQAPAPAGEADPHAIAALRAQYAARGFLLFRAQEHDAPAAARWALTRSDRLTGMLRRDIATFRDVDFAVRLFADYERHVWRPY